MEFLFLLAVAWVFGSSSSSSSSPAATRPSSSALPKPDFVKVGGVDLVWFELGAPTAQHKLPLVVFLAPTGGDPYLEAIHAEASAAARSLQVAEVGGSLSAAALRELLDELGDRYGRQVVLAAVPGEASALAMAVASKPRAASLVAAIVLEPTPTAAEPVAPTVVLGTLAHELGVRLDALAEAGDPIALVSDGSPTSFALMVLATAELNQ